MKRMLLMVLVILGIFSAHARAQANDAPATKTLVYDLRGLLIGKKGQENPAARYITLIQDTVDSNNWIDNGGATGRISEIDGMLLITNTEAVHRQIEQLLGQLSEKQARLVRIRAHWIVGESAQLQFAQAGPGATQAIDPAALQNLPKELLHHRAEAVCFSGQEVVLASGIQRNYIRNVDPVVGEQSVGYDPVIATAMDGAELHITPTLQTDGKSAWIDLRCDVSDWIQSETTDMRAIAGPSTKPVQGDAVLQRPTIRLQSLKTSLRVPTGQAVVVGGMTVQPGLQAANGPQMVLVVEVFVDASGD